MSIAADELRRQRGLPLRPEARGNSRLLGIANTWTEIGTCNVHLREIAEALKQGIREAGGTPMEFNTVTISDGITMGTQGMKASLVSREVIADSIELVARGNLFD